MLRSALHSKNPSQSESYYKNNESLTPATPNTIKRILIEKSHARYTIDIGDMFLNAASESGASYCSNQISTFKTPEHLIIADFDYILLNKKRKYKLSKFLYNKKREHLYPNEPHIIYYQDQNSKKNTLAKSTLGYWNSQDDQYHAIIPKKIGESKANYFNSDEWIYEITEHTNLNYCPEKIPKKPQSRAEKSFWRSIENIVAQGHPIAITSILDRPDIINNYIKNSELKDKDIDILFGRFDKFFAYNNKKNVADDAFKRIHILQAITLFGQKYKKFPKKIIICDEKSEHNFVDRASAFQTTHYKDVNDWLKQETEVSSVLDSIKHTKIARKITNALVSEPEDCNPPLPARQKKTIGKKIFLFTFLGLVLVGALILALLYHYDQIKFWFN